MSVFLGENAQGKSNLLEAIYFISCGRSFRTNKIQEMVQWGQERFCVRCEVEFSGVSHRLETSVGGGGGKYLLDGKPRRGSAVFGNFKAVIFASEDLDVVRQEPATRRRFFDLFFSQIDLEYGKHLDDYLDIVRNRNFLLKSERFDALDVWNGLMVREAGWLIWRRRNLLEQFAQTASAHHRAVSANKEDMRLRYKTFDEEETQGVSWSAAERSPEEIAQGLKKKLAEHEEHERILKVTLVGPHRDDYEIGIRDKTVRHFGSEGQKRSVMLSLRMAQWKYLAGLVGEPPMILLDDVLGELDEQRQDAFLEMVVSSGAQVFVALTQARENLRRVCRAVFRVRQGILESESERAARA